jgi:hypothetical protein
MAAWQPGVDHATHINPKSWLLRFDATAPILIGIVRTTAHWKALDQSFLLSRRSLESVEDQHYRIKS